MGDIYTPRSKRNQTAMELPGNTKGRKWKLKMENVKQK